MPDAMNPSIRGYVIEELLGSGANGRVYGAVEQVTGRRVAVKWLPWSRRPESAGRFQREVQAIAALRHPNIVTLYSAGVAEGGHYLVLERVDGFTLDRILAARSLGPAALADIFARIARALEVAHEAGIVHRDVKPSNVLVDRSGAPRLVDFGLARLGGASALTGPGAVLGTFAYMAPEVLNEGAARVTSAVDVYSLGAMLYEALAGTPPFLAETMPETLALTLAGKVPDLPRGVSPALGRVCLAMLARDPARRPGAGEVADALEAIARAPARPEPRARRRAVAAMVVAAGIAAGGGVVLLGSSSPKPQRSSEPETATVVSSAGTAVVVAPPEKAPVATSSVVRGAAVDPVASGATDEVIPLATSSDFREWWRRMTVRTDLEALDRLAQSSLPRESSNTRHRAQLLAVSARSLLLRGRTDEARKKIEAAIGLRNCGMHATVVAYAMARARKDDATAVGLRDRIAAHDEKFSDTTGLVFVEACEAAVNKLPGWEQKVAFAEASPDGDKALLEYVVARLR